MLDQRLKKTFIIVKGMATWLMIEIHVIVIVSMLYAQTLFTLNGPGANLPMPLSIFGLYTLSFPILSGCIFRSTLEDQILRQRLIDINWSQLLKIVYFLFFMEGLRNFLLRFNLTDAIAWNVLQTVAISFILIAMLMRRSIHLLIGTSLAVLLLTPYIHQNLLLLLPSLNGEISGYHQSLIILYSLFIGLFFSIPVYLLLKERKLRILFSGCAFILVMTLSYLKLGNEINSDPKLLYTLMDLPLSLWTGGGKGQTYWPFVNWFPSVAFGFIFTHFLLGYRNTNYIKIVHLLSLVLCFIYFKFYFQTEYIDRANNSSLFTSDFFSVSSITLIGVISFFVCHFFAIWLISEKITINPRGIIHVYSRALLYIYIFHTIFAWWLARLLKSFQLTFIPTLIVVLLMTTLASYWLGLFVIDKFNMNEEGSV